RRVHPGAHRRRRRLAAFAPRRPRSAECVCRPVGQRGGRRYARGMRGECRREPPPLGHRSHHGYRVGQAPLPGVAADQGRAGPGSLEKRGAHFPAWRIPHRLMSGRVDVNAFLGAYPWRKVPGTSPEALTKALDRVTIDTAWVTHLPGLFWRDPTEGNAWLYETARKAGSGRFKPVPTVHPGLAHWKEVLAAAVDAGAPAVRCDPLYLGLEPSGSEMRALATACGAVGLPLVLAVRLEDGRQRHPNDRIGELTAASVRALIRSDDQVRLLVTHADRAFIEEVHFGSTPDEARRIWWDICWIWGQ